MLLSIDTSQLRENALGIWTRYIWPYMQAYPAQSVMIILVAFFIIRRGRYNAKLFKLAGEDSKWSHIPFAAEGKIFRIFWNTEWYKLTLAITAAALAASVPLGMDNIAFPLALYLIGIRGVLSFRIADRFDRGPVFGILMTILRGTSIRMLERDQREG